MEQEEVKELARIEVILNAMVENSNELEENATAEATPNQQNEAIQQEGIDTHRNANVEFEGY